MAVKANVLLKTIGEKIGLNADQITKLTGNTQLSTIDIDDDVANHFTNTEFFTADAAVSDGKIRGRIRAEIMNGTDADIERLAAKHGLSSEEVAELKKLDKTSMKLEKFSEKIAELENKKASASGKAKSDLEKEIDKLNGQVSATRLEFEAKLAEKDTQMANAQIGWEKSSRFKSLDYAVPEGVSKDDYMIGAQAILDKKLAEKGIKFKLTEDGFEPFDVKEDKRYYENNVKISADDLIKKVANESKLLRTSQGEQKQTNQRQQSQHQTQKPDIRIMNEGAFADKMALAMERDFNVGGVS